MVPAMTPPLQEAVENQVAQEGDRDADRNPKKQAVSHTDDIRHENNKWHGYKLDYKNALKTGEGQPFYLEPRDIVYVPRTNIAKLNQWIDQYINKIIPRTGLNFTYPAGAGFIGVDTSGTVVVP